MKARSCCKWRRLTARRLELSRSRMIELSTSAVGVCWLFSLVTISTRKMRVSRRRTRLGHSRGSFNPNTLTSRPSNSRWSPLKTFLTRTMSRKSGSLLWHPASFSGSSGRWLVLDGESHDSITPVKMICDRFCLSSSVHFSSEHDRNSVASVAWPFAVSKAIKHNSTKIKTHVVFISSGEREANYWMLENAINKRRRRHLTRASQVRKEKRSNGKRFESDRTDSLSLSLSHSLQVEKHDPLSHLLLLTTSILCVWLHYATVSRGKR